MVVSIYRPATHFDHSGLLSSLKSNYNNVLREVYQDNAREISLGDYVTEAWPIIEPGKKFKFSRAITAVVDHLEAVSKGTIQKLAISIPPRHSKSSIVSILWPTWEWTFNPYTQWLTASYNIGLSVRFALASRRLIQSQWYQKHWGKIFKLVKDQNVKSRYQNNLNGQRIATAMRASVTGENADRIVVDDAHNVTQAHSDKIRESTLEAFDKAISTRINDNKTGAIVIIAHRVHEDDVTGHILKSNEYEHLILPSEYNPNARLKSHTSLGFTDWRTEPGQLLWEDRFDKEFLNKEHIRLGASEYSAQHDQDPIPGEGAIFNENDFRYITPQDYLKLSVENKILYLHRHWDLAATENSTSAFTAGVLMSMDTDDNIYIVDVQEKRLTPGKAEIWIKEVAVVDGYNVSITVEEEKGASGKYTTNDFKKILKGFDVRGQELWADKVTRARALCGYVEAHKVILVKAPWNSDYMAQMTRFPKTTLKDKVDATSGGFREIIKKQMEIAKNNSTKKPTTNYNRPYAT